MRHAAHFCLFALVALTTLAQATLAQTPLAQAPPRFSVPTDVTAVTVFQQGAQVTRTGEVQLAAGERVLAFEGLTAMLDQASLQVATDAAVTVLSVVHRIDYLASEVEPDSVAMLRSLLSSAQDSIAIVRQTLEVYQAEQQLLMDNRDLGGQDGVQVGELVAAADFMRERMLEINANRRKLDRQLRRLQAEAFRIEQQLEELGRRNVSRPQSIVEVTVRADQSVSATFSVRYRVDQAGWRPAYDVRVASVGDPVELSYAAQVFQRTEEPWEDVDLSLSTGDPNRSLEIPELFPWRLEFMRPIARMRQQSASRTTQGAYVANPTQVQGTVLDAETGVPLFGATVRLVGLNQGTSVDALGRFELNLPSGGRRQVLEAQFVGYSPISVPIQSESITFYLAPAYESLDEVVVESGADRQFAKSAEAPIAAQPATRERQATTTNFDLDEPYSIPPDGKTYRVDVGRHQVPAAFRYTAVPKYDRTAFLTAGLSDWASIDLVSGPASLFFEGTYLGNTVLDIANVSDTLNVSLGPDPGVVIERDVDTQFAERNFLRNRITEQRGYVITIRNNKEVPISIAVQDQVPLSTDERISIDIEELSGAQLNEATGFVTWNLTIPPNERREVRLRFAVTYPTGERIRLE